MAFGKRKSRKNMPPEGMAHLVTASNTIEADILESKLKSYGIEVFRKYRENGAYLTLVLGLSSLGVDLFVPEERAKEAKEILKSAEGIKDEDILADPSFKDKALKAENEEFLKKLDKRAKWMALFFIAAAAVLIYYILKG